MKIISQLNSNYCQFKIPAIITGVLLLMIVYACNTGTGTDKPVQRPVDVWVFRSVLDKKPRMITLALEEKLWVAYNTQTAGLYKAWNGKITGKIFTDGTEQPKAAGRTYFQETDSIPWRIIENSGIVAIPKIQYKGHAFVDGHVVLKYDLESNDNRIHVQEMPEYFRDKDSALSLKRTFSVSGLKGGTTLQLNVHLASINNEQDIRTDGKFNITKNAIDSQGINSLRAIDGNLLLNKKKTEFSVILQRLSDTAYVVKKEPSKEEAAIALINKSDCNTCHNKEVKTVGPSYMDIARRYAGKNNAGQLINKIIDGGAGNWGNIPMTAHPDLPSTDAFLIVSYIKGLYNTAASPKKTVNRFMPVTSYDISFTPLYPESMPSDKELPGSAVNVYQSTERVYGFKEFSKDILPASSGSLNAFNMGPADFPDWKENFVMKATGFITIKSRGKIKFRLVCDDGGRLIIDGKIVVTNTGNFGGEAKEGELVLTEGKHPFTLDYYQRGGGKLLSLQWKKGDQQSFEVVPPQVLTHNQSDIKRTKAILARKDTVLVPGDRSPLIAVHPAFSLYQARPASFTPKVGAMDFLPDGRLVVCTWDSLGAVYLVDGVLGNDPEKIKVKRIAFGLAEVLGVKVVDNEIYVLQKQELTKLVDVNKDDIIDDFQVVCNGWEVTANFHEFAFGLLYKDGYFYGTTATDIRPGGASETNQPASRGKVIRISKKDGSYSFVASGLRTPNGIGFGIDNEMFICDNQGDWLPANKLIHFEQDAWYGSRAVDFAGTENKKAHPPVVYLPQDEIANSPSQPALLNKGIYKNQLIFGDVTYGGLQRVSAEKINGVWQGAVFMFTQGLEAGVNRIIWGPDGNLYVGGCGQRGNWAQTGKQQYGLQRLSFNNNIPFEMLAVRAKQNGLEIEFTQPLKERAGGLLTDYFVKQWWYKPTAEYGGPKMDEEVLSVSNVAISQDRKKAFLTIPAIKQGHVVYLRLNRNNIRNANNDFLWTTETWYTMNEIP